MGRLFYHVIGSFAEFEREMIVERVRAGLANARAKGRSLGRPKDRIAEMRIIALREKGLSLREIAKCDILCGNCHRKLHSGENQAYTAA